MVLTEFDQTFVIIGYVCISVIFQIIPTQFIHIIRRIVAVFHNFTVFIHFLPQEIFSGMNKRNTLRGHVNCSCQIVHPDQVRFRCIRSCQFQLVHQSVIVVTGHIVYGLCRARTPGSCCCETFTDVFFFSCGTWHETGALSIGSGQ